jgi:hypothetical protein
LIFKRQQQFLFFSGKTHLFHLLSAEPPLFKQPSQHPEQQQQQLQPRRSMKNSYFA